ncbi:MAG: hypothetical protein SVY15_04110 [Halobacteriota archaeon]|nr:hypothetical protein [Halobacteriota archaeon]
MHLVKPLPKDLELQEFIKDLEENKRKTDLMMKDLEESKRKIDLSIRELQEMRCML